MTTSNTQQQSHYICVYAASSVKLAPEYHAQATRLGQLIGQAGYTLIYGAGDIGLMGAVARAVHVYNGRVIGVVPERLNKPGIVYPETDELIVTETMRERKAWMEERADAFIVLPGGYGTLEEMLEIIVLRQLFYTQKPLVLLNTKGAYDAFITFIDHLVDESFIKQEHRKLFHTVDHPEAALDYIATYTPEPLPPKLEIIP